ncbi:MAG: hypothetical protein U1A78_32085 [Polyangia bacterium]
MRAQRLESALKALLFGEAWASGWRPGAEATLGPLALLALQRVRRPELHAELGEEPTEWVRVLFEAPRWLASWPQSNPATLGPEPLPTALMLLGLVASYRAPTHLGLGAFLAEQLLRCHRRAEELAVLAEGRLEREHFGRSREVRLSGQDPLAVQVAVLQAIERLPVDRATRVLRSRRRLAEYCWAAARTLDLSLCQPELVLALHAAQAGGFLLSAALQHLTPLLGKWRPMRVLPLAALFCAAQSPEAAVPESWSDCLSAESAALVDAAAWAEGERSRDVPKV